MTRKESREQAFILLFEYSFIKESAESLFDIAKEAGVDAEDDFCISVVNAAIENVEAIDEEIEKFSKGWNATRLSKVVLAALRLAITEIKYFSDIPSSVSINESIELVKKYATEQDASYTNGILGSIVRNGDV